MKAMRNAFVVSLLATLAASPLAAITGREVMEKADAVPEPKTSMSQVQMDLVDKNGTVQSRMMLEYGREPEDLKDIVIIFQSPASVKDTRFLQKDKEGGGSDKWIYMPSLRSTRRIAASEGDKSFMGSDATYDDLSGRELDDYEYELLSESEPKGKWTTYKVECTPKPTTDSQYSKLVTWIDHDTFVPVYTEMYDKDGKLLKELEVMDLQVVGGYQTPMLNELRNVQTGHSTKLAIKQIKVDLALPDRIFTTNFLNTGK